MRVERVNVEVSLINRHQRRVYEARKRAAAKVWNAWKEQMRPSVEIVRGWANRVSRDPAYLDLCMMSGVYEDHLAESHGDAEDVFT